MSQSLISILLSENFVVLSQGSPFGSMSFTRRAFGIERAREGLEGSFETVWALPGSSAGIDVPSWVCTTFIPANHGDNDNDNDNDKF